ncbi:MAG: Ig-like domain-containing protein [Gammaproteobacteria bacterium]
MAMVAAFVLASGMLLAGCGSSGGSPSSGGDTTKPSIMLTNPAKDATGVPVAAVLSASFSEAMKLSTISDVTFIVNTGSDQVAGKVGFSALSNAATFTPDIPFKYDTTYTVTIKAASVTDMSNNSLNVNSPTGDYVWNFTTTRSGSVDSSFGGGTGGTGNSSVAITPFSNDGSSEARAIAIQPDGMIVAAGSAWNGHDWDFALARYSRDGILDMTFGPNGTGIMVLDLDGGKHDIAHAIQIDSSGKIVVAGFVSKGPNDNDFALVRWNSNGTLDKTFGTSSNGIVTTDFSGRSDVVYALAIQPDDKIVVAGFSGYRGTATVPIFFDAYQANAIIFGSGLTAVDFALARYDQSGKLDNSFDNDGKVTARVGDNASIARALALQADGKIVVAGYADKGGKANFALARYNSDGNLDNGFAGGGTVITPIAPSNDNGALSVAIQPDGKIIAAGTVENDSGGSDFSLARYSPDGSLDSGFAGDGTVITSVGANGGAVAFAVTVQGDGKILAAGVASNGNDSDFAMTRYGVNGSLDNSFGLGGRVITPVRSRADVAFSVAIQSTPDNKIIMAGRSLRPTGVLYDFALVRYWP